MKIILVSIVAFILGSFIGDYLRGTTRYQQDIGQVKSITLTRYFFVGYSIGGKADGNIQWNTVDGDPPKKKEIYNFIKKTYTDIKFEYDELIIVGLYEFKTKKEWEQFFNSQKEAKH